MDIVLHKVCRPSKPSDKPASGFLIRSSAANMPEWVMDFIKLETFPQ